MQVVHLVVEVEGRRMTVGALRLAEEQLLAAQLALGRLRPDRAGPSAVELRRGREVEHVLHLGHVAHLDPVEDVHALLHRVDRVAVEVGGPLLELGEVLDRAQAALRAVDLLVEQAAQADRVEPEAALLRPDVGVEVELAGRVAVDVAVEAGHAQAGLAVLRSSVGIELLLRERRQQQAQAVELHRRQDVLEQAVVVVDRDHLAARDVAQLGPVLQEDRRRKLGQERLGQIEVDVEPLQAREHLDLHWRKDLAAGRVLGMRQRGIGEDACLANLLRAPSGQTLPASRPSPSGRSGPTASGLPRDILARGSSVGVRS